MADHNTDFYLSSEYLQDDVSKDRDTVDDFRILVDFWTIPILPSCGDVSAV